MLTPSLKYRPRNPQFSGEVTMLLIGDRETRSLNCGIRPVFYTRRRK